MGIFCQNGVFSNVLIAWGPEVEVLTVCRTNCKTGGNLEG
jgi:hypothetical protein